MREREREGGSERDTVRKEDGVDCSQMEKIVKIKQVREVRNRDY